MTKKRIESQEPVVAVAEPKQTTQIVLTLTKEEMYELKYCLNKELAWKVQSLQQIKGGLLANAKVPDDMKEKEKTQEQWMEGKIATLTTIMSKIKMLAKKPR